ncbi:MAG: hypothetical protein ABJA80_04385 [bacterium]
MTTHSQFPGNLSPEFRMSIRQLYRASIAVAFLGLAGCGADSATAAPTVVGSFTLQTIDGQPLPFTIIDESDSTGVFKIDVLSPSSISIDPNGSFRFIITSRLTATGMPTTVAADTATGTYALTARHLSLTANGSTLEADWDGGGALTMVDAPHTLVFRR